jgi:hypothetical protein
MNGAAPVQELYCQTTCIDSYSLRILFLLLNLVIIIFFICYLVVEVVISPVITVLSTEALS